ncbi:hypothetical protein P691DRAFT_694018 [Macrolepiota fuliginosa MF-IS2]|uniref:Dihydrofolate reductase n=1 Tax=Macrolepiota fuliginosa MF-IS2 TaxID=1400762 RepID=A0A9P5XN57_9AGAR|nr:hypothetical protein P691DRAFT_694018 [Macrolepiota fuliginosa MF-IS2]
MSRLTIIVAATKANGIGQNGQLPWRLSRELKYFAHVTSNAPEGKQNAVIMGRNTWESIPPKFRPLPKRLNIVISRNSEYNLSVASDAPVVLVKDLQSALDLIKNQKTTIHRGFVIGGASLYTETLGLSSSMEAEVDRVLLTRILSPEFTECDTFMPNFLEAGDGKQWAQASHESLNEWVGFDVPEGIQEENGVHYEFQMWTRKV